MKWYPFFITLCLLLFCGLHAQCQDTHKYVYQDSAILYPETEQIQAPGVVEGNEEETTETIFADTSLINNQLILSPDSIRALKNAKPFAYAKSLDSLLIAYQDGQQEKYDSSPSFLDRFFSSELTKVFFWMLAGLFIAFLVYKLFFTQGFFQRQSAKAKVTVLDEEIKDDPGSTDYERLIAKAVSNNNYRLAVRYLYLRALQKLAAAGAIELTADKTNAVYLRELSGKPYKNEFASLTLHYEYIWYGEFAPDEAAFKKLENRFKQFNTGYKQD
jgi:Domain of unknown function (DUF4129)